MRYSLDLNIVTDSGYLWDITLLAVNALAISVIILYRNDILCHLIEATLISEVDSI